MSQHSMPSRSQSHSDSYRSWSLADHQILKVLQALAALSHREASVNCGESSHNAGHFRAQVKDADRAEGGRLRAILKLVLYFVDNITKHPVIIIATGFLLNATTIGTAGHCVYHPKYGRLIGVEVFLGYNEKSYDEVRYGDLVAVPNIYIDGQEKDDLAVIRLDEPFQEYVTAIDWVNTPDLVELLEIKVPGFPNDLSVGKVMYEGRQQHVKVDLGSSHGMIQYLVDTCAGQSGAPVLWAEGRDGPLRAIGVHVRGPRADHPVVCCGQACKNFNEAVAFGPMGHDLATLLAFIDALPKTKHPAKLARKAIVAFIDALAESNHATDSGHIMIPGEPISHINHASDIGQVHGHQKVHIDCDNRLHQRNTGKFTQELGSRTVWLSICDLPLEQHLIQFPSEVKSHALIGFAMTRSNSGKDQHSILRCIITNTFLHVLLYLALRSLLS